MTEVGLRALHTRLRYPLPYTEAFMGCAETHGDELCLCQVRKALGFGFEVIPRSLEQSLNNHRTPTTCETKFMNPGTELMVHRPAVRFQPAEALETGRRLVLVLHLFRLIPRTK